ncbi:MULTISPECIES: GDYXXLXY domain-containing protein [Helicobacter]|uniref:GDYXXLXY domain-containing protein n=1 Tax=Helicobacter ganmani TaxID=60246 RepID=A0A3D8IBQ0_9HELI|nr:MULTISPECIES: GDYXXLXY domain-containing protein [Helicobacter]RDU62550.1 hypothetical protein CQA43_06525 [Helicobacter ganmani]
MLRTKWLFLACALQFILIGAMFVSAYLPIYFGTEVKVIAKGYDPRDLLSGDFVWLDYGVKLKKSIYAEIPLNAEVFVCLERVDKGNFIFKEILTKPPKNQLYIKTKAPKSYFSRLSLGRNIEKYFTTKEKAQEIQNLLAKPNNQAIVTLKVFRGKARIVDLKVESKQ